MCFCKCFFFYSFTWNIMNNFNVNIVIYLKLCDRVVPAMTIKRMWRKNVVRTPLQFIFWSTSADCVIIAKARVDFEIYPLYSIAQNKIMLIVNKCIIEPFQKLTRYSSFILNKRKYFVLCLQIVLLLFK